MPAPLDPTGYLDFKIEGLAALLDKLAKLPPKFQRGGFARSVKKGARVIRKEIAQRARRLDDKATANSIAKNVAVRFASRMSKQKGIIAYRVGILGGAKQRVKNVVNVRKQRVGKQYATGGDTSNPGGDTFYWRFLELGTSNAPASPFMVPAMEASAEPAATAVEAQLNLEIDKAVREVGGRA